MPWGKKRGLRCSPDSVWTQGQTSQRAARFECQCRRKSSTAGTPEQRNWFSDREQKHQATGPQRETKFLLLSNISLFPATLCVRSRLRAALPRIISRDTYLDVVLREFLGAVRLVDDLRHPDHFALVVANWQAQDQIRLVSRLHVDPRIEAWILSKFHVCFIDFFWLL